MTMGLGQKIRPSKSLKALNFAPEATVVAVRNERAAPFYWAPEPGNCSESSASSEEDFQGHLVTLKLEICRWLEAV